MKKPLRLLIPVQDEKAVDAEGAPKKAKPEAQIPNKSRQKNAPGGRVRQGTSGFDGQDSDYELSMNNIPPFAKGSCEKIK